MCLRDMCVSMVTSMHPTEIVSLYRIAIVSIAYRRLRFPKRVDDEGCAATWIANVSEGMFALVYMRVCVRVRVHAPSLP